MNGFDGLHANLTGQIIGIAFTVSNELGIGFIESVYRKAMLVALRQAGLDAPEEVPIPVFFRNEPLGVFKADLVVNGCVILELKVGDSVMRSHENPTYPLPKINTYRGRHHPGIRRESNLKKE